jgi:Ca2+-binding EF-hand superfamily protein
MLKAALAAALLTPPSALLAQAAPKPVSRADYLKAVDNRFASVDTNHDGKLSKDELQAQQQRDMEQARKVVAAQVQAQFRKLDTNKDGQLTMQEFMAAAPAVRTAETPDQLLQKFDSNGDGRISPDEFRAPEIAKFNRVDTNRDGIVTPAELQAANRK